MKGIKKMSYMVFWWHWVRGIFPSRRRQHVIGKHLPDCTGHIEDESIVH
jgi:hypothetical protein